MKIDDLGWLDVAYEADYYDHSEDRAGNSPKVIVIHGTGGGSSARAVAEYFETVNASTHVIIDRTGEIVQGVPFGRAAWGNGTVSGTFITKTFGTRNPNLYAISIELLKNADNSDSPTEAQFLACAELVTFLCERYAIPKKHCTDKSGGILEHNEIDPIGKPDCPGPFPWDRFYKHINGETGPFPGWRYDGDRVLGPDGTPVVLGFKSFILDPANHWQADNIPLEAEKGASVIIHSSGQESGTVQTFLYDRLVWSHSGGVRRAPIGKELLWSESQGGQGQQIEVIPAIVREDVRSLLSAVYKLKNDVGIEA